MCWTSGSIPLRRSWPVKSRWIPFNADPVLELLRGDAAWLLGESGLGTLAVGGSAADGKAAGLGVSGDGLRERARAFAGLLSVALPFIPGDTSLNLLAEGRLESVIADAARFNRFSDGNHNKYVEPYRSFVGYLTEDLARIAKSSLPAVADGIVVRPLHLQGQRTAAQVPRGAGTRGPVAQGQRRSGGLGNERDCRPCRRIGAASSGSGRLPPGGPRRNGWQPVGG